MITRRQKTKGITVVFLGYCVLCFSSQSHATNISEFVQITPYIEVQGIYDDNVFELSGDAAIPENGKQEDDFYTNVKAGAGVNLTLERAYLTLGAKLNYDFTYSAYVNNTDLNDTQHNLDFDFNFASKYEEGLLKDRVKVNIKDVLALIPFDEEEPLFSGNRTLRNDLELGAEYKIISTRRINFAVGYSYLRTDYGNDPIDVVTMNHQDDSSQFTQESQIHKGTANFNYLLNPKLTYILKYSYEFADREKAEGQLVSANFARQEVLSGIQAKLTPRIHANVQGGYSMTTYEDIGDQSQDDQKSAVAEASITANFAHQPLMNLGYRRYYTENDFGDTLLTDDVFARMGVKIVNGFIVNFSGDYIRENRDVNDDETTQHLFGVSTEYEILKNMQLLAGYNYKKRAFFEQNFLFTGTREETSHIFSTGIQYKLGRYFLLKSIYDYTDKTSNVVAQEFNRKRLTISGKVLF